jgi:hypothetical protein
LLASSLLFFIIVGIPSVAASMLFLAFLLLLVFFAFAEVLLSFCSW